jgi:transposase-like protein
MGDPIRARVRKALEPFRSARRQIVARGRDLYLDPWSLALPVPRAVDKQGKTVDFLLRPDRGIAAAQAFFRKALASHPRGPRKVTIDGHVPTRRALWRLRREHPIWRNVEVRTCKYLNNIVEQDHRAIKRRCASMIGFKSFHNASIALAGVELAHRIRKRQFSFGRGRPPRRSMRTMWAMVMV